MPHSKEIKARLADWVLEIVGKKLKPHQLINEFFSFLEKWGYEIVEKKQ